MVCDKPPDPQHVWLVTAVGKNVGCVRRACVLAEQHPQLEWGLALPGLRVLNRAGRDGSQQEDDQNGAPQTGLLVPRQSPVYETGVN